MGSEPKIGLYGFLSATEGSSSALTSFLKDIGDLAKDEPGTILWFAHKFTPPLTHPSHEFLIYDAFPDEDARQAHLKGKCAADFYKAVPSLISPPPLSETFVYLASKVVRGASIICGIHVTIKAKPEKVDALKEFLKNAKPLIQDEADTLVWHAIEFIERVGTFAIIDAFPSKEGRQAHLDGKVAAALFGPGKELLSAEPEVEMFDVISAKL